MAMCLEATLAVGLNPNIFQQLGFASARIIWEKGAKLSAISPVGRRKLHLCKHRDLAATLMLQGHVGGLHSSLAWIRFESSIYPDPVINFVTGLSNFTLRDIFKNGDVSSDTGGIRAATLPQNFPAVREQGLSVVRFKMVPCGSNLPHTHPRASEVLSLLSGGPLQVGFVDAAGASHIDILYPGDLTVFPRGVLHFELNVGSVEAEYLSALNSENPGTLTSSEALFRIPLRTLATALNVDQKTVKWLKSTVSPYGPGLKKTANSGCVPGRDVTTAF